VVAMARRQIYIIWGSRLVRRKYRRLGKIYNFRKTFTPNPGAQVKGFPLEEDITDEWLKIVTFTFASIHMPTDALRGEIVHELAPVYLGHTPMSEGQEEEADNLVKEWGFEAE
jgi:hypothetical protein